MKIHLNNDVFFSALLMRCGVFCKYNELNVRKKITNARGQIRQVFYDAMGRVTGFTSPEGAVSYTYDANSNVLTVNDSHGTITRTYDALSRNVEEKVLVNYNNF